MCCCGLCSLKFSTVGDNICGVFELCNEVIKNDLSFYK